MIDNTNTTVYDPELMDRVNLSDPEELENHLQVLDVRTRLRQRRRRMIRCFTVGFVVVGVGLSVQYGFFWNSENSAPQDNNQNGGMASTGSDTKLPQPPADLASKCSLTNLNSPQGIDICEEACEISDCCNVPDGYALSCLTTNTVVCAQYQRYCDILHNLPSDSGFGGDAPVAVAPMDDAALKVQIDSACVDLSDASMIRPGSPCMTFCESGFCCFDNASSSCTVNCQTYLNCNVAHQVISTGTVSTPPPGSSLTIAEEIEQFCGDVVEAIAPPSGENSCETLCAPSFCCFKHMCVSPADLDCLAYSGCYPLFTETDTVDDDDTLATIPIQDQIADACRALEDDVQATDCRTLCAPGACCFETNLECPTTIECVDTYDDCKVLYSSNSGGGGTTTDGNTGASEGDGSSTIHTLTKAEVDDACENHNNSGVTSLPTLCEQVCTLQVMQCCHHQNGDPDDCAPLPCATYQACKKLGTDADSLRSSHKQELNAACSGTATRSQCIQLCSAATCCYATTVEEECANVDASITCSDYDACKVLYDTGDGKR
jgi:hypothetical protein